MDKINLTIKKLTELNEEDWTVALEKCRRLINGRVKGRTIYGCHSEQFLGMTPFDYYVKEAIDKLYSGTWEWKNAYSFSDQMCRIIGSLISENVRKYKLEKKKDSELTKPPIAFDSIANLIGVEFDEDINIANKEKVYEDQLNVIIRAIDGKGDMETLLFYIMEGKSNDEICDETSWERKKLYKIADCMKTKVKDFIATQSKEIAK